MSSTDPSVDTALAYPEPPASLLWHRHGTVQARLLNDAQRRRNRELLALAARPPRKPGAVAQRSRPCSTT